jgi:hypothetical protein
MDFIAIRVYKKFLKDARVIIMENKNCAIVFHVFVNKTKYLVHIIINVTIIGGDNSGRYLDKRT